MAMKYWRVPLAAVLALLTLNKMSPSSTSGTAEAAIKKKRPKGAPGPIAGAGLPMLAMAGAYWLIRRRNMRVGDSDSK
jgi:hypothetical protein